MKLIREVLENPVKLISESNLGKGKTYFIEGIFLQSNITNRNKRLYKEETMDREVDRKSTRLNSSHMSESRMPSSA